MLATISAPVTWQNLVETLHKYLTLSRMPIAHGTWCKSIGQALPVLTSSSPECGQYYVSSTHIPRTALTRKDRTRHACATDVPVIESVAPQLFGPRYLPPCVCFTTLTHTHTRESFGIPRCVRHPAGRVGFPQWWQQVLGTGDSCLELGRQRGRSPCVGKTMS